MPWCLSCNINEIGYLDRCPSVKNVTQATVRSTDVTKDVTKAYFLTRKRRFLMYSDIYD